MVRAAIDEILHAIAETNIDAHIALFKAFCPLCRKGDKEHFHSFKDRYEVIIRALLYAAEQVKKRR